LEGRAREVLGQEAYGRRRAVRRDERADRGLLDLADEVARRGDRVGEALPESDRTGIRARDPASLRGRGLRRRAHARAPRARAAPAVADAIIIGARARLAVAAPEVVRSAAVTAADDDTRRAIEAVFRIESPRLIAGLARIVRH